MSSSPVTALHPLAKPASDSTSTLGIEPAPQDSPKTKLVENRAVASTSTCSSQRTASNSNSGTTSSIKPNNKRSIESTIEGEGSLARMNPTKTLKTFPLFTSAATTSASTSTSQVAGSGTPQFRWYPTRAAVLPCLYGTFQHSAVTTALGKSQKVAAYDIDGCLIKTHGSKFPSSEKDWKLWHASVPVRIRELHEQGFSIVLFSNQNYVGKRLDWFKAKMPAVSNALGVPLRVFAATLKDEHRKGMGIGMWTKYLAETGLSSQDIDWQESFFVGDAAGRPAGSGRPKDHSAVDLQFAKAVGLRFYTPEQHFLGQA